MHFSKKHLITSCIAASSLVLGAAGCDKLPANGELDGMWQLTQMTPAATGETADKKAEHIYWSFQLDMMMIHTPDVLHNGKTYNTSALFSRQGDSLHVNSVFVHYVNRDSIISDPASTTLDAVGIHGNAAHFRIDQLSSDHMQLTSDYCRLSFRKL